MVVSVVVVSKLKKSCPWSLQILLEHRRRFINIERGIMQSGKHPIALAWVRVKR